MRRACVVDFHFSSLLYHRSLTRAGVDDVRMISERQMPCYMPCICTLEPERHDRVAMLFVSTHARVLFE